MKREFLQSFQVDGKPLSKEVIDAIMAENGRDIQKAKAGFSDYEQLKLELEQTKEQLQELHALDFAGAQQAAKDWEVKFNQAQLQHQQELSQLRFDHQLQLAIDRAKGRNAKAIAALLDVEDLKNSKDPQQAISQALEQLKTDSAYLFEAAQIPPPYAKGTGSQTGTQVNTPVTLAGAIKEKYERKY